MSGSDFDTNQKRNDANSKSRTDFWQNIGILISLSIAGLSLFQTHVSNSRAQCLSEAVPKLMASISSLSAIRSTAIESRDRYRQSVTGFVVRNLGNNASKLGNQKARELVQIIVNGNLGIRGVASDLEPFVDTDIVAELDIITGKNESTALSLNCDFSLSGKELSDEVARCVNAQVAHYDKIIKMVGDEVLRRNQEPVFCEAAWEISIL